MSIVVVLVIACVLLALELHMRAKLGQHPANARELYQLTLKKNAPDPRVPALCFAFTAWFSFSIWEAGMRAILDLKSFFWPIPVLAFLLACFIFGRRLKLWQKKPPAMPFYREEIWALSVSFALLLHSWAALLLMPWMWWRANYLPTLRKRATRDAQNS